MEKWKLYNIISILFAGLISAIGYFSTMKKSNETVFFYPN